MLEYLHSFQLSKKADTLTRINWNLKVNLEHSNSPTLALIETLNRGLSRSGKVVSTPPLAPNKEPSFARRDVRESLGSISITCRSETQQWVRKWERGRKGQENLTFTWRTSTHTHSKAYNNTRNMHRDSCVVPSSIGLGRKAVIPVVTKPFVCEITFFEFIFATPFLAFLRFPVCSDGALLSSVRLSNQIYAAYHLLIVGRFCFFLIN